MKIKIARPMTLCVLAGLALGCAGVGGYEERYRIFYLTGEMSQADPGATADEIAQRFAPTAAVNLSMVELAREGFILKSIEPVETGARAWVFTFRRSKRAFARTTVAPIEYNGLYRVQEIAAEASYYVFVPYSEGYVIHIIRPGEAMQTNIVPWNRRERNFSWVTGDLIDNITISRDGRRLRHTTDTYTVGDIERVHETVEATKVRIVQ